MHEHWSYEGMRVVVSGGGGAGMGAAVVREVVELGGEVHVLDLKEPPVPVASHRRVDLSDPDAMAAAVDAIGGRFDALFNCVGVSGLPRFSDLDTMLVNFAGVRHLTELVAERIDAGGAIASVASAAGVGWEREETLAALLPLIETSGFEEAADWCAAHPDEIATGYGPSKKAVALWTPYACVDLGARGIRINCAMPGPTETPMLGELKQKVQEGFWDDYPIPLGRASVPAEQARALVFLNSRAASCVTGAQLITDGGSVPASMTGRLTLPPVRLVFLER
jgi:NAD(P)-dependent dehydrogenase (short-subunit alcohol dehydrogenase family)